MSKFKNVKILLFSFIFLATFCFMNNSVFAKEITPDEIQGPAYVIGSHIFNREVNENTGYDGRLTTNLIMLASKTIETSDLDEMVIYYKTGAGIWINGLTGETIEPPTSFDINYTNLQLEEINNTVSAPKAPILVLDGPLSINNETDMMTYQLNMYIDDIDDKTNKVDGVELTITDYESHIKSQDLKYSDGKFANSVNINDSYTGDALEFGREYHFDSIRFENTPDGFYSISARAYVEDGNGKRSYSDYVFISVNPDTTFPQLQITNKYTNPDYVSFDGNYYTYRLGVEMPEAYLYKIKKDRFAYVVYEVEDNTRREVGTFGLDEEFNVYVPKNSQKTYYAKLGFYDKDNKLNLYSYINSGIEYTIDKRELTTPTLEWWNSGLGISDLQHGEYILIDKEVYEDADKNSFDSQMEGVEIYEIVNNNGIKQYNLISDKFHFAHVFPTNGYSTYIARVYAKDVNGKTVYSEYSDEIKIVRAPEIEVTKENGQAKIKVLNTSEFGNANIKYKVYANDAEIAEVSSIDEIKTVDLTETTKIYVKAFIDDIYSHKSNSVEIVVE